MKRLSQGQEKQIQSFKGLLLEHNSSFNLLSRKNPQTQLRFLCRQVFYTAEVLSPFFQNIHPVLDLGSGNGFPGLFLAILFPKNHFFLCERKRKKAEFLKFALHKAKIFNSKVFCQEAESLKKPFEIILSQAALPLDKMAKILTSLLKKPTGSAFLWQNETWPAKWHKDKAFSLKVFKTYKERGFSQKILLKIQWKKEGLNK